MEFSRPEYWSGLPCPPPWDLPNPGIKPRSAALQADSLPAEPQGKPKNAGEGSLSLLQRIFPTQESNRGLLHCRQILYQLSYQGNPIRFKGFINKRNHALYRNMQIQYLIKTYRTYFQYIIIKRESIYNRKVLILLSISNH